MVQKYLPKNALLFEYKTIDFMTSGDFYNMKFEDDKLYIISNADDVTRRKCFPVKRAISVCRHTYNYCEQNNLSKCGEWIIDCLVESNNVAPECIEIHIPSNNFLLPFLLLCGFAILGYICCCSNRIWRLLIKLCVCLAELFDSMKVRIDKKSEEVRIISIHNNIEENPVEIELLPEHNNNYNGEPENNSSNTNNEVNELLEVVRDEMKPKLRSSFIRMIKSFWKMNFSLLRLLFYFAIKSRWSIVFLIFFIAFPLICIFITLYFYFYVMPYIGLKNE